MPRVVSILTITDSIFHNFFIIVYYYSIDDRARMLPVLISALINYFA
jgi:hypothetical protein